MTVSNFNSNYLRKCFGTQSLKAYITHRPSLKLLTYIINGHGFGWTPGVGDGQGGLACCGSWGRKESDTTERLN